MSIINNIIERAKRDKKTIILTEGNDFRVLEAIKKCIDNNICNIILINDSDVNINGLKVINPKNSELSEKFINELYELRNNKGLTLDEAKDLILNNYMYFACMMVKDRMADGIVSGATHSTTDTLKPALQIIKTKENVDIVSSFFLMDVPNCNYGSNGTFIFGDSGLVQNPTSDELATIAKCCADSFNLLVEEEPIVAMLSHSTLGSAAKHDDIEKVVEAVRIAKDKYPYLKVDGELQVDAAIDVKVAKTKAPNSEFAGRANVLIFPDLDAGNIGYKLVQRLAKADAYGPICQGIKYPVNDLSRGCSSFDIVGAIAITCLQAQNNE